METPCRCDSPGQCATHQRYMSAEQHRQCREDAGMFAAFGRLAELEKRRGGKSPIKGPSLIRRAGNAARAAGRVAGAVAKGEAVLAPPELAKARLEVCKTCKKFSKHQMCLAKGCGCYIPAKVTLLTETCPLGKWPSKDEVGDK